MEYGQMIQPPSSGVRVAFIGNSIQYYNDCPRFVANLSSHRIILHQDSYLRGGANLSELWDGMAHGAPHWASMRNAFATEEEMMMILIAANHIINLIAVLTRRFCVSLTPQHQHYDY